MVMRNMHWGFRRKILFLCLAWAPAAGWSAAENEMPARGRSALAELSLEELSNIEITSVYKKPERLSEAAAAIFLITREDIRRSGVTSIPEALRLASNLQVARVDSSQYAISARGFNSTTANKLLVLIDGRSVYTAFLRGVLGRAGHVAGGHRAHRNHQRSRRNQVFSRLVISLSSRRGSSISSFWKIKCALRSTRKPRNVPA